jgi:DNA invertase Pin-like site-specific DNA recombinase
MSGRLVGYAWVSTDPRDHATQREALAALGVPGERIYIDEGLAGGDTERPGLRDALAACRSGDTLVVTKLHRLARSLPDARDIARQLADRRIALNLDGVQHEPTDPLNSLLLKVLVAVTEFEADLIRMRTREGLRAARAKGRLRGRRPKLTRDQESRLVDLYNAGEHTAAELAATFGVARSTVYRALERSRRGSP